MKQQTNRIEQELDDWKAKEQRQAKLFSPAAIASRTFQREKLAHYGQLEAKYRRPQNADERLSSKLLRWEKRKIEKQLYPNRLVRLARRAVLLAIKPIKKAVVQSRLARNEKQLQEQLSGIGFHSQGKGLQRMIRQGNDEFKMPASWYPNEKEKMDFDLSFKKQNNGTYKLDGYKAALSHEDSPGQKRQHTFHLKPNEEVTGQQATNLLAGRAVKNGDKWLILDLNDKDSSGNYRVKQFRQGYGYDLEKALKQLPIKELKNPQTRSQLLEGLENGQRQQVNLKLGGKDRKLFIEANPQFKTINVYEQDGKKVSVGQALGKELKLQQKEGQQVTQTMKASKRNSVSMGA